MKPPHFGSKAITAANRSTTTAAEHMAVPMATFICESGWLGCQKNRANGKEPRTCPSMLGLCVSTDLCQLSPERVSKSEWWKSVSKNCNL
jgi:hypothetical protein